MAERDAFGREVGEDAIASMGWPSGGTPPATPPAAPTRATQPATTVQAAAGRPQPQIPPLSAVPGAERFVRRIPMIMMVSTVAMFVVIGAVVVSVVTGVKGTVDSISEGVSSVVTPKVDDGRGATTAGPAEETPAAERPVQATPSAPPTGLGRGSLLLRTNFGAAMTRLRTSGLGRLTNLRVAPERIDAQLLTKDGRLRNVQIQPGGTLKNFGASGPGFGAIGTMSMARIDPAAPSRLTVQAAGRLRTGASKVNYLVYSEDFDDPWAVYFKGGQYFRADAHGRVTQRYS